MKRGWAAVVVAGTLTVPTLAGLSAAQASDVHTLIQSSGSSWAAIAVNQWVSDVNSQGIKVVYSPNGDAAGRQDFANKTSDFSVTSLGYQGRDPVTGVNDTSQGRPYAYLPIAAGGTAFPYQIKIHGKQVKNLRLSGETLAKIFTGRITNWSDPEITKDNNGVAIPSLPITPVVQSEGSGATAQLTRYFAKEYPSIWAPFNGGHDTLTEYFPPPSGGSATIAQNGSDGAMNYISSSSANGSIGYVEYSYALNQDYPVAKLLNRAGVYTLPTQYNVAVALEKAQINMDKSSPNYLLQNLDHVYTDPDPRTYPLSSYVYMIEPTGTNKQDSSMNTAKRQTIADFAYYSICQGQAEIGPIGYSSLPVNLVEAGFGQLNKLKAADPKVDLTERNVSTCNNPTFIKGHPDSNYLAKIAPQPPACDHVGAGPCAYGVTSNGVNTISNPNASGKVVGGKAVVTSHGGAPSTSSQAPAASGVSHSTGHDGDVKSSGGSPSQISSQGGNDSGTTAQADQQLTASAGLAGYRASHLTRVLAPLAVLLLLVALVLPPVIAYRMSVKRRGLG
jgi:phosphate transport system substrate-binding protein